MGLPPAAAPWLGVWVTPGTQRLSPVVLSESRPHLEAGLFMEARNGFVPLMAL